MFRELIFLALVAAAWSQFVVQAPFALPQQNPYHFAYSAHNPIEGSVNFHEETADERNERTGSYGYTDAYGLYRRVDYVAGAGGYHASVSTNEPGTSSTPSADVSYAAPGFL